MKKILLIGLITINFIVLSCIGQNINKNDLSMFNLKGKVKSLTDTGFKVVNKFGDYKKGDIIYNHFCSFNESGKIIEYYRKNNLYDSGDIYYKFNDDAESKIGEAESYIGHWTKPVFEGDGKMIFKYDDKGNRIEVFRYFGIHFNDYTGKPDSLIDKLTFKYDDKGNIIEEKSYNNGSFSTLNIYKYDDKGNKIEENDYRQDGSLDYKSIYKYDDKGNKNEIVYNPDGSLWYKENYSYDVKGNLIKDSKETNEQSFDIYSFKYDNKGNMIECILNDEKGTYKYDDKGNIIEISSSNYLKKYTYIYNEKGDWIKKTDFNENDIPQTITERVITYY